MVERGPVSGATPSSPQKGASGSRTPGQNSTRSPEAGSRVIFRKGSGKSAASSPKPGIEAVQPQSAGSNSSRSTWSVSPGSAPETSTGPVTGRRARSRAVRASRWSSWRQAGRSRRRGSRTRRPRLIRRSRSAGSPGPRPGGSGRDGHGPMRTAGSFDDLLRPPRVPAILLTGALGVSLRAGSGSRRSGRGHDRWRGAGRTGRPRPPNRRRRRRRRTRRGR